MSPPPGPPPAPPPPPPPVFSSSSVLQSSRWTPSNSNREVRSTISTPSKSPAPGLDAQTLQHAAAGLRKTQYSKSLRSDEPSISERRLEREDVRLPGRYWQNSAFDETLEPNKTRETLYAPSYGARDTMPIGNFNRHTDSLNNTSERPPYSTISYNQYSTYQQKRNNNGVEPKVISSSSYYITDPQSKIREYATQTSAYSPPEKAASQLYEDHIRKSNPQYNKPTKKQDDFIKELRDQGLTRTQRIANQFQQSAVRDIKPPPSLNNIVEQKSRLGNDKIDELIRDMEWKMKTGFWTEDENKCYACGEAIGEGKPGCRALEKTYHIACFKCDTCGKKLAGSSFYNVGGKPLCEEDYTNTLERCTKCGEVIAERLLRASGSAYHPKCFACTVCKKSLDNVPYTLDSENQTHCIPCFQDRFAPRCAVCSKPIIPKEGEKESFRIVAMDKSFHVDCYRCEDCNLQLSAKMAGQGCYPIDQHLYCKNCSGKRLIAMSKAS